MITVNDPDVMNILIDVRSIENTLLIAEKGVARQVMSRPPTNARSVSHIYNNVIGIISLTSILFTCYY